MCRQAIWPAVVSITTISNLSAILSLQVQEFVHFYVTRFQANMTENPEGGGAQTSDAYDYKRLHSFPLIKVSSELRRALL